MASCVVEVTCLLGLFKKLGVELHQPIDMFCDNKVANQIVANPIFHERTKHTYIDYYFVRKTELRDNYDTP